MGSLHNMRYFFILIGSIALLLSSTATYAQYPDIPGKYSGKVTQIESNCGTGLPTDVTISGPFVGSDNTFTITISSQSSSCFSGSGTQAEPDGSESTNINFSDTADTSTIYNSLRGVRIWIDELILFSVLHIYPYQFKVNLGLVI